MKDRWTIFKIIIMGFGFSFEYAKSRGNTLDLPRFKVDYNASRYCDSMLRIRVFTTNRIIFRIHLNRGQ